MTNDLGSGERGREMKNSDTDDDVDNGVPFSEEVGFYLVIFYSFVGDIFFFIIFLHPFFRMYYQWICGDLEVNGIHWLVCSSTF